MRKLTKKFTLLSVLFLCVSQLQAQELSFGPKVGYNSAKLEGKSFKEFHENNTKSGYHVGLFAELRFDNFAIQPEVYYSSEGGKLATLNEDNLAIEHDFNLDYVQVPLMFKWYLTNAIAIEAGPQAGFLKSSNVTWSDLGENSEKFNEFNFSVNAGVSINLPLSLMISARYNAGLTNVYDDPDINWKNRVLQISVGYRF